MASPALRRYRRISAAAAALILPADADLGALDALFGRRAPRRLELGCGHGEFIAALAAAHPEEDCLGIELDPLRVNKAAHKCAAAGAQHVRLLAAAAEAVLPRLPPAAFHRIYALFPDPWPKRAHRRRRLLNRATLLALARLAVPGCRLIVSSDCHEYALQVLTNATTLPGLWRPLLPNGYALDLPVRFVTVFERHKRAEGARIMHVHLERSAVPLP
ncbi:MAG: methyltransferase domain-containing protein [Planctomycetota bacterium]|nr:methyltransferase domain-containing protein [Planctomycetota bacterium]MDW8372142.1 methyltransferase domain-containing protein [Planctomycetota bacterium]